MPEQPERLADSGAEVAELRSRVEKLESELAEHDRTRQMLVEEHSFRSAVIERAAEGICVCHAVPEFPFVRFTVWNPRMEDLTGYSMEAINRVGWYQTMYADPVTREKARDRMGQMREGVDLRNEQWEVTRADGVQREFSISTSILKSSDGHTHALALMQDVTDAVRQRRQLESHVTHLEGLLPICSSCRQIRDGKGNWHHLEIYIRDHSDAQFTHSICPACEGLIYPDVD